MELKSNTTSEKIDVNGKNKLTINIIKGCLLVKGYFISGGFLREGLICEVNNHVIDVSKYSEIEFECTVDCNFNYTLD